MTLAIRIGVFIAVTLLGLLLVRLGGARRGSFFAVVVAIVVLSVWYFVELEGGKPAAMKETVTALVTSTDCARCHERHYQTWYRTYHRTMTREATPEYVKGDFANAVHYTGNLPTRLTRRGDEFFMNTVDPGWALARATGKADAVMGAPRFREFRVDRLVGSHWLQECLHRLPDGRFIRLPVVYHIGEKRWVHTSGAFLAPESEDFWALSRASVWNSSCLYCHNTGPSKNPISGHDSRTAGFDTEVLELGIACAACHGPGVEHVKLHEGKTALGKKALNDVVSPTELSIPRRDEICARCHGALVPKAAMWDPHTHRDPYTPGEELTRYNSYFWSEAEQAVLSGVRRPGNKPAHPEPNDGRFWGDGTPLTTALEYNGMALSACYKGGHGKLSCLSCHTMHGKEPNMLLKPGMESNNACYSCHPAYRERLSEHTKHPAASSGSLCYNCHMPHQVYSLMTTHRSHRIQTPDLASSLGTGKPHACNLCHLDKSLGWTREQLSRWPGQKNAKVTLTREQEEISSALLILLQGDARSRAVVAGAFSQPEALRASGKEWIGSQVTRILENERYPAVRYLLHRGLRTLPLDSRSYDPLAPLDVRKDSLRRLRDLYDASPMKRAAPGIPLTSNGLPDEAIVERLRRKRNDPDLTVNE